MQGKPLTPIVDTDDIWDAGASFGEKWREINSVQTNEFSLFSHIKEDGLISYNDVARAVCVSINNLEQYLS